ncbi:MAG TPA: F0F1 ATP synthase subunit gamma [Candidatus Limnocylindrales bacterium]|nr:F0F1 ATP synthase subunit gamma [Candidatus Limnocylindrales bacterium]
MFRAIYRACALSMAAENISRLAAMQAAEKNINERLDLLKTAYQQERQAAITAELRRYHLWLQSSAFKAWQPDAEWPR